MIDDAGGIVIDDAAQQSWDLNIAGGDIPKWADLDEGSKERWRKSLTAGMWAISNYLNALIEPLVRPIARFFDWVGRRTRSNDGSDG